MPLELMEQAKTHLEFLGYTISPIEGEDELLHVTRPGKYSFSLTATDHILRLYAYFTMKKVEQSGCLEFLNSLNLTAVLVCFSRNNSNTLVCQGAFFGGYNKASFAMFLEAWDYDIGKTLKERSSELFKYIAGGS